MKCENIITMHCKFQTRRVRELQNRCGDLHYVLAARAAGDSALRRGAQLGYVGELRNGRTVSQIIFSSHHKPHGISTRRISQAGGFLSPQRRHIRNESRHVDAGARHLRAVAFARRHRRGARSKDDDSGAQQTPTNAQSHHRQRGHFHRQQ